VQLLDEMGGLIDRQQIDRQTRLDWERRVLKQLDSAEVDLFMRVPAETDIDPGALPEMRWRGLRNVLLRRKGLFNA
jgi:hypothetical protein